MRVTQKQIVAAIKQLEQERQTVKVFMAECIMRVMGLNRYNNRQYGLFYDAITNMVDRGKAKREWIRDEAFYGLPTK